MNLLEILSILQWWLFIFLIGLFFQPLTARLFSSFIDRGYAFSKIVGIIFITYFTFLLGIFHVLPFNKMTLFVVLFIFVALQTYRFGKKSFISKIAPMKFLILEEVFFLACLFLWAYVRGFAPEIHGLEKYMDYGFINSILRSNYFPPRDMWLTPMSINYYYFGHLVTAVLTKLSSTPPQISYNLMLGTIMGLTFTASFSIGISLFINMKKLVKYNFLKLLAVGLLTAFLVTFSGNLHTIYTLFKPYENEKPVPFWELEFSGVNPCYNKDFYTRIDEKGKKEIIKCSIEERKILSLFPNAYWYPNATRFIHNTIHEFPIYSWVVADLHGHVLDIPFVLLTIGFGLALFLRSQNPGDEKEKRRIKLLNNIQKFLNLERWNLRIGDILFAGFLLAIMYMTNAWDGIIYLLLFVILFFIIFWQRTKDKSIIQKLINILPIFLFINAIMFIIFIIFSLPFSIFFKPFASGIGILCAPEFLIKIKEFGPILFEPNHCQKSPFWQLLILYGFFYFFVLSFLVFLLKVKKLLTSDIFILILIFLATILIIVPEFIYLKDIYPDHYRANTMFKLVFQAFILLSIASGYIIVRIISNITFSSLSASKYQISNIKSVVFSVIFTLTTLLLLCLVFVYPFQATYSYYGNLIKYKGIDGTAYLKESYPDDYEGIEFLKKNIVGQPVILEAQGDSYTDYARVSSNTGLPTVLGWTVHEWLWRGSYDVPAPRISDIQTLYESNDISKTIKLLKKYKIQYVFIGSLEREKYPQLNESKFQKLGQFVFKKGETKIYLINKVD